MVSGKRLRGIVFRSLGTALLFGCANPALAQDSPGADIDATIDASQGPADAESFARRQIAQGDLLGAAATLERALFDRGASGTANARALYITVLCKVDDHERALVEAGRFGDGRASDAAWAEAEAACGPLPRPAQVASNRASIRGSVAVGAAFDSDALGALSQFFIVPGFSVPGQEGGAFIANVNVDARLPAGAGFVYGGLDFTDKNSFAGPLLDYQLVTARLGYGLPIGRTELSFGPVATYARLQGFDLVGEFGGQVRLAMPAPDSGRFQLTGEVVYQDYAGSSLFFSRDGVRYDLALSYQHVSQHRASYELGGGVEYKTADTDYLGYAAGRIFGAVRAPLNDHGTYASFSATYRHVENRTQPFLGKVVENRYFLRGAVGMPIGIPNFDAEAAVSYTRRDYDSVSLQDYSSVGAELRLVWRFGK